MLLLRLRVPSDIASSCKNRGCEVRASTHTHRNARTERNVHTHTHTHTHTGTHPLSKHFGPVRPSAEFALPPFVRRLPSEKALLGLFPGLLSPGGLVCEREPEREKETRAHTRAHAHAHAPAAALPQKTVPTIPRSLRSIPASSVAS